MTLTKADYQMCEEVCFRSWKVRLTPQSSRVLIRAGLEMMQLNRGWTREWLTNKLRVEARQRYEMHPALLWLILRVVLPIIIKLLIRWWTDRERLQQAETGIEWGR